MSEQIGLEAVFDMQRFDQGIANYISGVKRANDVTDKTKGSFGAAFDDMGSRVLKASAIVGGAFVSAVAAAGAATAAFVGKGIKGAMDLESQMGAIAAVMGETKDAVVPLKELIFDLGLDPTLKVTADEAADAIEKLASNGLTMTQIMEGAAKATVLLANSTAADFDTAAAIATDTMALFNIKAEDMMTAVNGITGVTVASKFTINDYRLALAQAGGVAAATGVEFEDFNTTIAGISNYFASGSDAGTSFKTMLLRLVPSTSAAAEAMTDINLTTVNAQAAMQYLADKGVAPVSNNLNELYNQAAEVFFATNNLEVGSEEAAEKFNKWAIETGLVQSAFFDANGQMKEMSEISSLLNTALAGLSEQEKSKALNTIFGTDAMRAAVGIAEQGEIAYTDQALAAKELGVSYDSLTAAMEGGLTKFEALQIQLGNTDAAEAAKVRMDNFKGSLEILRGVIDTVGLQIGFIFLPLLKEIADRAAELVSQYAPMIVQFFESFSKGLEQVLASGDWTSIFPDWLAQAISLIAENMDLLTGALGGVAAILATAGLSAAFSAIGVAIAAVLSPMGLLILGAGALGAAWNTNFLGIKDITMAVLAPIQEAFSAFSNLVLVVGDAGIKSLEAQEALSLFPSSLQGIIGWGLAAWGAISNFVITVQDAGLKSLEAKEALSLLGEVFGGIVSALAAQLPIFIDQMLQWAAATVNWLKVASDNISPKLAEWMGGLLNFLSSNLPTWIAKLLEWSAVLVNWIGVAIVNSIPKLSEWLVSIVNWISGEGKTQLGTSASSLVSPLIDWINNELIPKVGPAMANFGLQLFNSITTIAGILGVAALAVGGAIYSNILATDWKSLGDKILTLLKEGWELAKATVLPILGSVATEVLEKFTSIDWNQVGIDILTFLKDGFESIKSTILPIFESSANSIRDKFSSIDWKQLGTDSFTLVKDGWEFAKTTILPIIEKIATDTRDKFSSIDWKQLGTDSSNAIRDGLKQAAELAEGLIKVAGTIATAVKDSFTTLTWTEIGTNINNSIRDSLNEAANLSDGLLASAGKIVSDLVGKFALTDWKEVGKGIAIFIKDGIAEAANMAEGLLTAATTVVSELKGKFTGADWKGTGTTVIDSLRDGLKLAAYAAAGVVYVVSQIVSGMVEEFTGIDMDAIGISLMEALRDGLQTSVDAANGLYAKAGEIVTALKKVFTDTIEAFKSIGTDIIDGIGVGITNAKEKLKQKAQELANSLPGWVKSVLGISSPSKVFAEIGRNIIEGLIIGIQKETGKLNQVVNNIFKNLSSKEILGLDIDVTDNFASRSEEIIGNIRERMEEIGTLEEQETRRIELQNKISELNSSADENREEKILELRKELELLNGAQREYIQLQGELSSLQSLEFSVKNLRSQQQSIRLFEDYIGLLEEAGTLGLDISRFSILPGNSTETLKQMVELEQQLAALRSGQLRVQAEGLQATIAEKKLLAERAKGMEKALLQLQPLMDGSIVESTFGKRYQQQVLNPILDTLGKIAENEQERNRLIGIYAEKTSKLQSLAYFQTEANLLEDRVGLLQQAANLGIDISGFGVDYDRSVAGLSQMVELEERIAQAKIGQLQQQGNLLKLKQQEEAAEKKRLQGLKEAMEQLQGIMDRTGSISSVFAQMYKSSILDPILENLRESAGIDAERLKLIAQYNVFASRLASVQHFEKSSQLMENYVSLLNEAKGLGIDIRSFPITPGTDPEGLHELIRLEQQVAEERFNNLVKQSIELRKQQQQQEERFSFEKHILAAVETFNDRTRMQLDLMQKAVELGIDLGNVIPNNTLLIDGSYESQRLLLKLQQAIADQTGENMRNQIMNIHEEQKRVQGLESALRQLQPLIDQTNVTSAFGQRYKATVLDPILKALDQAAGIDSERVRLIGEYTRAAQKLVEINKKEEQLGFLQQQLDIVKMIHDQDLVGGASLFDGIAFGVNASIDDLLTLTNRVLNAMITETKDELGIHSPSTVFAEIGQNMMRGLSQGIQQGMVRPFSMLQQATMERGMVSSRTLNLSMGGVNIYTPMDEIMFENKVLRIMERAI